MSRLNKFLANFADEEEKKKAAEEEKKKSEDEEKKAIEEKKKKKFEEKNQPQALTPDGLIRPVERIRSKRITDEDQAEPVVKAQKQSGLKLKLGAKKPAETKVVEEPEKPQRRRRTSPDPIDTADELEELEKLFHKSGTPIEYKERWIVTVRKARAANGVKTMFNTKVCAGKFRFTKEGDIEILPDLDTAGKSSSDIISMDWHISKKVD